jgi:hypothetical protein
MFDSSGRGQLQRAPSDRCRRIQHESGSRFLQIAFDNNFFHTSSSCDSLVRFFMRSNDSYLYVHFFFSLVAVQCAFCVITIVSILQNPKT